MLLHGSEGGRGGTTDVVLREDSQESTAHVARCLTVEKSTMPGVLPGQQCPCSHGMLAAGTCEMDAQQGMPATLMLAHDLITEGCV